MNQVASFCEVGKQGHFDIWSTTRSPNSKLKAQRSKFSARWRAVVSDETEQAQRSNFTAQSSREPAIKLRPPETVTRPVLLPGPQAGGCNWKHVSWTRGDGLSLPPREKPKTSRPF